MMYLARRGPGGRLCQCNATRAGQAGEACLRVVVCAPKCGKRVLLSSCCKNVFVSQRETDVETECPFLTPRGNVGHAAKSLNIKVQYVYAFIPAPAPRVVSSCHLCPDPLF